MGSCGDSAASAILAPGWWLRANDADSGAYLQVKRDLAERTWRYVQHYADAKTVILQRSWPAPPRLPSMARSVGGGPGHDRLGSAGGTGHRLGAAEVRGVPSF
jgi:hypothetical protein